MVSVHKLKLHTVADWRAKDLQDVWRDFLLGLPGTPDPDPSFDMRANSSERRKLVVQTLHSHSSRAAFT